jgi:hypothetical protein
MLTPGRRQAGAAVYPGRNPPSGISGGPRRAAPGAREQDGRPRRAADLAGDHG